METMVPLVHLRMVKEPGVKYNNECLDTAKKAAGFIKEYLKDRNKEYLISCSLDSSLNPINIQIVGIGRVNMCSIAVGEIFKVALLCNASGIIIFHNHPSGNPKPSYTDRQCTKMIKNAAKLVDIEFLDHIIIGADDMYYSFLENDVLLE